MRLLKQWKYKLPWQRKHKFIACFIILGLKKIAQLRTAPTRYNVRAQLLSQKSIHADSVEARSGRLTLHPRETSQHLPPCRPGAGSPVAGRWPQVTAPIQPAPLVRPPNRSCGRFLKSRSGDIAVSLTALLRPLPLEQIQRPSWRT